ncbi:MAG TPA: sugar kinase [Galbitalea sp.]|nr:sugar kinase [Galbitalea sp.]
MNPRAVCIGEALAVLVAERRGPLEEAETFRVGVGGAEFNVAVALASAGISTALLTRVGDDGFGRLICAEAELRGVGTAAIERDSSRSTGMYVKELGGTGDKATDLGPGRSRMHYYRAGSAGSTLSVEFLERPIVRTLLASAELVHITGITPALSAEAMAMSLRLAEREGRSFLLSVDLNWRPALWRGREADGAAALDRMIRGSDIAFIGASESREIYGIGEPSELRARFPEPRWLVVKNDAEAATAFDGDARADVPALALDVVEAIGAGDAFAAGFLAALVDGSTIADCLGAAHAMAARALASTGDSITGP